MPNAGEDRKRKLRTVCCQRVVVKAGQVRTCTAAADNHHRIKLFLHRSDSVQRTHDRQRGAVALHGSWEERRREAICRLLQLMHEVAVPRCIPR